MILNHDEMASLEEAWQVRGKMGAFRCLMGILQDKFIEFESLPEAESGKLSKEQSSILAAHFGLISGLAGSSFELIEAVKNLDVRAILADTSLLGRKPE